MYLFHCLKGRTKVIRSLGLLLVFMQFVSAAYAAAPQAVRLVEDYQVIQRDNNDEGACTVKLPEGASNAQIEITEDATHQPVAGVKTSPCELDGGRAGVLIEKIPVGGPYKIQVGAHKSFSNILVGDIWVTSGQSNMFGHALPVEQQPIIPGVNLYDTQMHNMEAHWCAAIPPLHRVKGDRERTEFKKFSGRIGPAESFCRKLYEDSGVPIGIIPTAIGASLDVWDPDKRANNNRYAFIYRHVMNAGGRIKGLIWAQGAQDAIYGDWDTAVTKPGMIKPVSTYGAEFKKFIDAMRRDFHNPDLVVIAAQEARAFNPPTYSLTGYEHVRSIQKQNNHNIAYGRSWEQIREIQRQAPEQIGNMHLVPMIDLDQMDIGHLDYAAYNRLGRRMAWLALPYVKKGVPSRSEIRLRSARWLKGKTYPQHMMRADCLMIEVEFEGVTGKLTAPGRPTGFQLRNPHKKTGEGEDWIIKTCFDPDKPNVAILYIMPQDNPDLKSFLYYGPGVAPYVNITDENDMGIPAFGPVQVEGAEDSANK
jgi:hypothetical protein